MWPDLTEVKKRRYLGRAERNHRQVLEVDRKALLEEFIVQRELAQFRSFQSKPGLDRGRTAFASSCQGFAPA